MDAMNTAEVAVAVVVAVPRTHEEIMVDIVNAEMWLEEYTRMRDIYSHRRWTVLEKYCVSETVRVRDEDMSMILDNEMPLAHRKIVEYYVEATRWIVLYRRRISALKIEIGMDRG